MTLTTSSVILVLQVLRVTSMLTGGSGILSKPLLNANDLAKASTPLLNANDLAKASTPLLDENGFKLAKESADLVDVNTLRVAGASSPLGEVDALKFSDESAPWVDVKRLKLAEKFAPFAKVDLTEVKPVKELEHWQEFQQAEQRVLFLDYDVSDGADDPLVKVEFLLKWV